MLTKDGSYDMQLTKGHQMVIERKGGGYSFDGWFRITPPDVQVFNPAFDVTPGELHHGVHHRARRRSARSPTSRPRSR